jgi:hypothetical protein
MNKTSSFSRKVGAEVAIRRERAGSLGERNIHVTGATI